VVRDMRYWKPWQPPLSTWIRRARLGFESLVMISERRFDARGVISTVISLPSSSFRGLRRTVVACLRVEVLKGCADEGSHRIEVLKLLWRRIVLVDMLGRRKSSIGGAR